MIRYIPQFILHNYIRRQFKGSFNGFALLFDLADFTFICAEFQKHGKQGAEELSIFLDFVFKEPIKIVEEMGGFVSLFAGDAFCAIFPDYEKHIDPSPVTSANKNDRQSDHCISHKPTRDKYRMLSTVLKVSDHFHDKGDYHCRIGDFALKIRQTVAYGKIDWQIFENDLQNEYFFYGKPLQALAELSAIKKDIIFSSEAVKQIGEDGFIQTGGNAFILKEGSVVQEFETAHRIESGTTLTEDSEDYQESLLRFLNPKYHNEKPHPEIRSAAFCFANLETVPINDRESVIEALSNLASSHGGYINKLDATDKGLIAIILFGMPRSEGNTLERLSRFALTATGQVPQLALGLAKGNVYAGFTGSIEIREYTALGHPVNLAVRLMSKARSGEIIIDNYLYQDLKDKFHFEERGSVILKGVAEPIMSYKLQKQLAERVVSSETRFVGRDNDLTELRQALDEAIGEDYNPAIYVYGDAGIGKSRLIKELLDCFPTKSYHKFFLYCDAILQKSLEPIKQTIRQYFRPETSQDIQQNITSFRTRWKLMAKDDAELIRIESIIASLLDYEWERSVWEMLPPPEKPKQLKAAFLRFMKEIAREKPILIHLDDGQWIDDQSREYLQALSEVEICPIHVICSCRYLDDGSKPELGLKKHKALHKDLGILDEAGSRELIKSMLRLDEAPPETIKEINSRATGNPFFIEQLCAYLIEIGKIDSEGDIVGELGPIASFSVNDIIGSRIDRLTDQVRECLYNASVLGMEFNVQVLSRMLNNPLERELELGESTMIWKELDELRYIFSHILIKDIAYLRILESRIKQLHQLAAEVMEMVFADAIDEHAEEIAYHFERAELEGKTATYYDKAGCWFRDKYNFNKGEVHSKKALEIREKCLGVEHPDTATSLFNLAYLYTNQGKYNEAEPLYLRALEIREKVLGEEHHDTTASLNGLAILYNYQGKYSEAEPLYLRALEIWEKVLGAEHPDTASLLNNLAELYYKQGKYAEAEPLYLKAHDIWEKMLGEEHPDTLLSLNNIACMYHRQGNYAEAERLHIRALEIKEKVLGAEHPDTAITHNNLASLYIDQGKYAKAEPMFLKALEIKEKVLGAEHPDTVMSLGSLAILNNNQGKYAEAEHLYLRALEIREKVLGAEHPYTAITLNNLASLYDDQRKYAEAEPLYLRALEIKEKVLGNEHPSTAFSAYCLADSYNRQGKYAEAEPLHLRALAIREKGLGAEHPDTAFSLHGLASLYRDQDKYEKSEPLYLRALDIWEKKLGYKHPWTIEAITGLIALYEKMDQPEKAAHYKAMIPEE